MSFGQGSRLVVAAVGAAMLLGGCTRIVAHQGYVVDETLLTAIQPGVDNKESVVGTLGRPSFVGQFDAQERDWYYVSRDTRQFAFHSPRPSAQTVLRIRFDEAGNVERVERTGLDLVANVRPSGEVTPTLGRSRSLFEELFGNIGAIGQTGQRGQTPDNPR